MGGGDGPSSSTPSLPGGVRHASQSTSSSSDVPYASALFLVVFDVKAGYTMTWRRTADAGAADLVEEDLLDASAAVEYKSLPSGLHEVAEDLVYFVHRGGRHAGLSAFVNRPTAEDGQRNARMLAVGVLVPLSYGRLGRAWRHAEGLREVAAKMAADMSDTSVLEKFWERIRPRRDETWDEQPATKDSPLDSPSLSFQRPMLRGHTRTRSASDGTALVPRGHRLTPYHPAWSLTSLLDTFGPLIFPIHRAALLRKRILISCHPPVHDICNYGMWDGRLACRAHISNCV